MKTLKLAIIAAAAGGVLIYVALYLLETKRLTFRDDITDNAEAVAAISAVLPIADEEISMIFVGDMMFDRGIAAHAEKNGAGTIFAGVKEMLLSNDAVVGNLEGTITGESSVARKNNAILHFTFDPLFAPLLRENGFTALSLANNHSSDFYGSGYKATKKFLDDSGVLHFGSASNDSELSTTFDIRGKRICLVGYHDLYTFDVRPAISEIRMLRTGSACDLIVAFAHWGNEYELKQTVRQTSLAHEFIDAGADLVIGAHPHVVQPVEIYKNKAIFYSLGNFVFDQGLSFWTEHGLAVRVVLSENETKFKLIPTVLNKGEVSIAGSSDAQKVLGVTELDSVEFTLEK